MLCHGISLAAYRMLAKMGQYIDQQMKSYSAELATQNSKL